MGSVLSLVKTLLSFAVLGAIGAYYVYIPRKGLKPRPPPPARELSGPSASKKKKTRQNTQPVAVPERGLATPSQPAVVFPGSFVDAQQLDERETDRTHEPNLVESAQEQDAKAQAAADKKKRKPKKSTTSAASSSTPTPTPVPEPASVPAQNSLLGPNDGPWTRVETRAKKPRPPTAVVAASPSVSSSGLTTEEDGEASVPAPESQQTLAERLVPRAPETKVDDMLEVPNDPSLARVMRIAPGPNDVPATGSWADYDDVSAEDMGDDDGFMPVKSRGKQRAARQVSSDSSAPPMRATETQTKRQRQNAARREVEKDAKALADRQREQALEKHRRERITDIYSTGGGKTVSGGQRATVDENFKLSWES